MKLLKEEVRTMIFYESPYRLMKTLQQFKEYFGGDRKASVSRELTKMFEETVNGTIDDLINHFGKKEVKGEIVIVVAGKGYDGENFSETEEGIEEMETENE